MLWDEPKIFFLERRYFFSIILSEFLKNRVALHQRSQDYLDYLKKRADDVEKESRDVEEKLDKIDRLQKALS